MTTESLDLVARVDAAAATLRARISPIPTIAVVLGTGLGRFTENLASQTVVPYADLPYWPQPKVAGHAGRLVHGTVRGQHVLALSGRVHLYEGHSAETVVFATRVLARLGVRILLLTNAAGGINTRFSDGALMVIDDHINFTGQNPLIGPHEPALGVRFPDMSEVYSARLRAIADTAAASVRVPVEHGVYLGVLGPSYETPAEIRAFRTMGADAVGMSTIAEAIAARHMGLEVLGISCIANMASGMSGQPLSEEEVLATSNRVQGAFGQLLEGIIVRL